MGTTDIELPDGVAVVRIGRPERRNAIDSATAQRLHDELIAFDEDPDRRVAVLTGDEAAFCAGADLRDLPRLRPSGPLGPTRLQLSKPVLAAVEGWCVAGGVELAAWCDIRVAGESARFGCLERRWGVPLIDGGTVRLPRLIGHSRALDMILTGRAVPGPEAHAWGLANRLVPRGEALAAATALAHEIARFPQLCLRTDRESALRQWDLDLAGALAAEARGGVAPLREEARGGAARFADGKGRGGDFGEL